MVILVSVRDLPLPSTMRNPCDETSSFPRPRTNSLVLHDEQSVLGSRHVVDYTVFAVRGVLPPEMLQPPLTANISRRHSDISLLD